MKYPYHTLAFLIFLLGSSSVAAQPFPMRAELKDGLILDTQVKQVTEWGFWLQNEQGLLFRQLKLVQTQSDSLKDEIIAFLPAALVEREGSVFTIRLEHLNIPLRRAKERLALREFMVMAGPSLGSRSGIETSFNIMTRFTGPVVFQLGHNIGWKLSGGGFMGGFSLGAGSSVPVGRLHFGLMAHAWKKYLYNENERVEVSKETLTSQAPDSYSITLFGEHRLVVPGSRLQIGVRYFLKDLELKEEEPRMSLVLGISRKP